MYLTGKAIRRTYGILLIWFDKIVIFNKLKCSRRSCSSRIKWPKASETWPKIRENFTVRGCVFVFLDAVLKNAAGRNLENQPEFTFEKIMEEEIIFIRVALQLFAVAYTV